MVAFFTIKSARGETVVNGSRDRIFDQSATVISQNHQWREYSETETSGRESSSRLNSQKVLRRGNDSMARTRTMKAQRIALNFMGATQLWALPLLSLPVCVGRRNRLSAKPTLWTFMNAWGKRSYLRDKAIFCRWAWAIYTVGRPFQFGP